jgi:hypothetical protein
MTGLTLPAQHGDTDSHVDRQNHPQSSSLVAQPAEWALAALIFR